MMFHSAFLSICKKDMQLIGGSYITVPTLLIYFEDGGCTQLLIVESFYLNNLMCLKRNHFEAYFDVHISTISLQLNQFVHFYL